MTTDERASIETVIAQERATVEHYRALLRQKAPRAQKVRWRALKRKHLEYIKRWEGELKT